MTITRNAEGTEATFVDDMVYGRYVAHVSKTTARDERGASGWAWKLTYTPSERGVAIGETAVNVESALHDLIFAPMVDDPRDVLETLASFVGAWDEAISYGSETSENRDLFPMDAEPWTKCADMFTLETMSEQADRRGRYAMRERMGLDAEDEFPSHAFPGGYPIGYLMDDGEIVCGTCVNDTSNPIHFDTDGPRDGWRVEGYMVFEESETGENCAHCGRVIVEADED